MFFPDNQGEAGMKSINGLLVIDATQLFSSPYQPVGTDTATSVVTSVVPALFHNFNRGLCHLQVFIYLHFIGQPITNTYHMRSVIFPIPTSCAPQSLSQCLNSLLVT